MWNVTDDQQNRESVSGSDTSAPAPGFALVGLGAAFSAFGAAAVAVQSTDRRVRAFPGDILTPIRDSHTIRKPILDLHS